MVENQKQTNKKHQATMGVQTSTEHKAPATSNVLISKIQPRDIGLCIPKARNQIAKEAQVEKSGVELHYIR